MTPGGAQVACRVLASISIILNVVSVVLVRRSVRAVETYRRELRLFRDAFPPVPPPPPPV